MEAAGGRVVKMTGDGSLSIFDGPARAIRCGQAFASAVRDLDIEVRVGLHTGECEVVEDDVAGLAVHIAERVCAAAAAGEVAVSRTVRDLVAGSGIELRGRGEHELKGVPDKWSCLRRPGATAIRSTSNPKPRPPTRRIASCWPRPAALRACFV